MRRRDFITALAGAALCPIPARAQQPKKVARISFLATGSLESPEQRTILNAFYQGLREHGYIDGQNVLVEVRVAESKIKRFSALASELVGLNLDVIVAANSVAADAARKHDGDRQTRNAVARIPIHLSQRENFFRAHVRQRCRADFNRGRNMHTGIFVSPRNVPLP